VIPAIRFTMLGFWLGMLLSFGAIFAPAAFRVLPETDLAAGIVGASLEALTPLACLLALLAAVLGLTPRPRSFLTYLRTGLPALGAIAHGVAWIYVHPVLAEIRASAGGSVGLLPPGNPLTVRFETLHLLSTQLFFAAGVIALTSAVWDLLAIPVRSRAAEELPMPDLSGPPGGRKRLERALGEADKTRA
jgi:hypothetical protein